MGNNTIMETISMGNVEISMSMRDEIIDAIFKVFFFASKIVLKYFFDKSSLLRNLFQFGEIFYVIKND